MRSKWTIAARLLSGVLCALAAYAVAAGNPKSSGAVAGKNPEEDIAKAIVIRPTEYKIVEYPWGRLTWYVSRELKNSDTMTVGEAVIRGGQEAPRHYHPNCDEVLHVVKGHILASLGKRTVEMGPGDTVSIPAGVHHGAKNVGTEDAVLAISYSSADRQVVGE